MGIVCIYGRSQRMNTSPFGFWQYNANHKLAIALMVSRHTIIRRYSYGLVPSTEVSLISVEALQTVAINQPETFQYSLTTVEYQTETMHGALCLIQYVWTCPTSDRKSRSVPVKATLDVYFRDPFHRLTVTQMIYKPTRAFSNRLATGCLAGPGIQYSVPEKTLRLWELFATRTTSGRGETEYLTTLRQRYNWSSVTHSLLWSRGPWGEQKTIIWMRKLYVESESCRTIPFPSCVSF